jgi:hypothetical protein
MIKKLLIMQLDSTYFLEETFRVLERYQHSLKNFEITVLAAPAALKDCNENWTPLCKGVTDNIDEVLSIDFDLSFNLSLEEKSWEIYDKVQSRNKLGFLQKDNQLFVPDLWSTFLLTIKSGIPFLTFHLQDIYRNILGLKNVAYTTQSYEPIKELILGSFNENFLVPNEKDKFTWQFKLLHPHIGIRHVADVDLISDLSHSLYVGPATMEAIRLGESGVRCLFFSKNFNGFNLLPYSGSHYLISTRGYMLESSEMLQATSNFISTGKLKSDSKYSNYELEHDPLFGAYLKSLNTSDVNYPVYQSHVVLWNFLLNLYEINLDISKCNQEQIEFIQEHKQTLSKLLRLHDYAMSSVDTIYQESKAQSSRAEIIDGHLKNLQEIEVLFNKTAASNSMLRPVLDYYRVRKGQNDGTNLSEQIQHSFLAYSEEHHALSALSELFSMTLRKNEASI